MKRVSNPKPTLAEKAMLEALDATRGAAYNVRPAGVMQDRRTKRRRTRAARTRAAIDES